MDTGHNKNVANFETTTIILTASGAEYAPPQPLDHECRITNASDRRKGALADVDEKQAANTIAVDEVQAEFKDLDKYVRNIKNHAAIVLNDPAFTADLQSIVNKFAPPGRKTGLPDDPLTPEDESRTPQSQSQRSRDNQIAYLADINALLKSREDYITTDTPYTTEGIEAKIAALTAKNNAAKASRSRPRQFKLDNRDALLYNDPDCMINRVNLIKPYVAQKFGKDSAVYQQINALEFRRVSLESRCIIH